MRYQLLSHILLSFNRDNLCLTAVKLKSKEIYIRYTLLILIGLRIFFKLFLLPRLFFIPLQQKSRRPVCRR